MKIHEFQAKALLGGYGVPVPRGMDCSTPEEAREAFDGLGCAVCVVKAQIHAGGRGKGGGVRSGGAWGGEIRWMGSEGDGGG